MTRTASPPSRRLLTRGSPSLIVARASPSRRSCSRISGEQPESWRGKATPPIPMSAPKLPVIFAPRARRDLDNILVYTLQHWGEEQEAIYADRIRRALALIGDNPLVGRSRDDLRVGVRAF